MRLIPERRRRRGAWPRLLAASLAGLVAGCSWSSVPRARVTATTIPAVSTERPLPVLPDDSGELPWIISESGRLTNEQHVKWVAARDAFWNRDTDRAVTLLRELRKDDVIASEHFYDLVLQCYAQSDRWADMPPLFAELGIEQSYAGWRQHAQFMAGLPRREFEFARPVTAGPMTLNGGIVIAEGEINGVKAKLMFDTGANLSWMSTSMAKRAGIPPTSQTISLSDSNGAGRDVPLAVVRDLRVGGLTVRNQPVMMSGSGLFGLMTQIDAIVGWDVLRHADITWDFPARRMTLAAPEGAVVEAPNLSGRIAPILTVVSAAGRPLHLFYDSGAAGTGAIDLYEHDGVLATKTPIADFRRNWMPTFSMGMHTVAVTWLRTARPYAFWMNGYRFDVPYADLHRAVKRQEGLADLDGVTGNGPFLCGTLRISATRREMTFEPALATLPAAGLGK